MICMYHIIYVDFPEWIIFSAFMDLIIPDMKTRCKLSNLTLIIMVFMKIRLNLFNEDIAHRFLEFIVQLCPETFTVSTT